MLIYRVLFTHLHYWLGVAMILFFMFVSGAFAQTFPIFSNNNSTPFYSYAPANGENAIQPKSSSKARKKNQYTRGLSLFRAGHHNKAARAWTKAADKGHVFAAWRLANMYRLAQGIKQDHGKAFKYYRLCSQKHIDDMRYGARARVTVDAIVNLAHYYRTGMKQAKLKPDYMRAFALYHLAATHYRHGVAQYSMGLMYVSGLGVRKDISRGMRWYMLAAQKNHAAAQAALGDLYWSGKKIPKNKVRGMMWYKLAKENAPKTKEASIGERLQGFSSEMDEKEQLEAETSATAWRAKYPSQNIARAQ